MTDQVRLWAERLRGSYWLVPTVLLLMGGGLAYLMTGLDRRYADVEFAWLAWIFRGTPQGAQSLLAAIASSVLGVAGTTFTITIAVLTLTSQQYGPRLLRAFMQDTRNQVVLGVFIGTFLYALLVMGMVRGVEGSAFVPRFAVGTALALAVLNAFMLVYFIQHVVSSIQVSRIVATAGDEMLRSIDRMCPRVGESPVGVRDPERAVAATRQRPPASTHAAVIVCRKGGYVQAIDTGHLVERAAEAEVRIELVRTAGEYVSAGTVLASVEPADRLTDRLSSSVRGSVTLGADPTPAQDLAFGPSQLAEIAVRALSTGINDPGTAIMCLDRLTAGLVLLVQREMPPNVHMDDDGCVRVVTRRASLERLLDVSLSQVRRYGMRDIEVLSRILRLLADVGQAARTSAQRDALLHNARLVLDDGLEALPTADARDRLRTEFDGFARLMEARHVGD